MSAVFDSAAFAIRPFAPADTEAVVALWQACGLTRPHNDPRRDIARKLAVQPELFLVGEAAGRLAASAMSGYDGHRGWIYYLAVHPGLQGRGLGRHMVAAVEERLLALGCPKINIQVRADNAAVAGFYTRLGFAADDLRSLGKRLIPDN